MREALSTDWTNLRRTVDIRKEVDQSGEEESRRINPERERQRRRRSPRIRRRIDVRRRPERRREESTRRISSPERERQMRRRSPQLRRTVELRRRTDRREERRTRTVSPDQERRARRSRERLSRRRRRSPATGSPTRRSPARSPGDRGPITSNSPNQHGDTTAPPSREEEDKVQVPQSTDHQPDVHQLEHPEIVDQPQAAPPIILEPLPPLPVVREVTPPPPSSPHPDSLRGLRIPEEDPVRTSKSAALTRRVKYLDEDTKRALRVTELIPQFNRWSKRCANALLKSTGAEEARVALLGSKFKLTPTLRKIRRNIDASLRKKTPIANGAWFSVNTRGQRLKVTIDRVVNTITEESWQEGRRSNLMKEICKEMNNDLYNMCFF